MLIAIRQIVRQLGILNNLMQQSTTIVRDKILRVFVTCVYADIILPPYHNDASNIRFEPPISVPIAMPTLFPS
jgi:hypothetical protein